MIYRILLVLLFFSSCKESSNVAHQESTLYKEVMEVHDKVMPELSTIHAIRRDLKAIERPNSKDIIFSQIKALDEADEAMMTWMADFKLPEDKTNENAYLEAEKIKISNVSDMMYSSIKNGKQMLDSLKAINIK